MTVTFLGNGGFISEGLPYNSFLIDNDFLIESPPDIMTTLRNQGVAFRHIKRIFLSHFHGDHYFGMPFLTLNLCNYYRELEQEAGKIEVISPINIRDHLMEIQRIAVSPDNPSVSFIDKIYTFCEIDESSQIQLSDAKQIIFHRMSHSKETYGFSIIERDRYELTYFPDTQWDDAFIKVLAHGPKYVICDMNSDSTDKIKVHMSELDIIERAIPITGNATQYIGTHLRHEAISSCKCISYAKAGMKLKI